MRLSLIGMDERSLLLLLLVEALCRGSVGP